MLSREVGVNKSDKKIAYGLFIVVSKSSVSPHYPANFFNRKTTRVIVNKILQVIYQYVVKPVNNIVSMFEHGAVVW